jgi:two-component system NarL family response regulator
MTSFARPDSPAPPGTKIRVLCVEDHRIVLDGIVRLIDRQPDMETVGAATSGEEGVELLRERGPDVVLMDLKLPGISGLEAIEAIRRLDTNVPIIVLTMYQGEEDIYRALEAGATTYLLKDALPDDLVRVIRDVYSGGRPTRPDVLAILADRKTPLTSRETEVVELIAKGFRNKEIAMTLGITEETAKSHVKNILSKLNLRDRAAVVSEALRRGILHIP